MRRRNAFVVLENLKGSIPQSMYNDVRRAMFDMSEANAQLLGHDAIQLDRTKMETYWLKYDSDVANFINLLREGGKVDPSDIPSGDGYSKKEVIDLFYRISEENKKLNQRINAEARRVGADIEYPGDDQGLHNSLSPTTGFFSELRNAHRNAWNMYKGQQVGLGNKKNIPGAIKAQESYLRGNTAIVDGKIKFRGSKLRPEYKHPLKNFDGKAEFTLDDVNASNYEAWIKRMASDKVDFEFSGRSNASNMTSTEPGSSYERKLGYLGPDVHPVTMQDFAVEIENKRRLLRSLESMSDGGATRIKSLPEAIANLRREHPLTKEQIEEVKVLESIIGNGDNGTMIDDFNTILGKGKVKEPTNKLSRAIEAIHSAYSSPAMKLYLQSNPSTTAMNEMNQAINMFASTGDLRYLYERLRTTPAAFAADAIAKAMGLPANWHSAPVPAQGRTKLNALANHIFNHGTMSNEQVAKATINSGIQEIKQWFFDASDPRQEFARSVWSPEKRDAIANAIKANDDGALFELTRAALIAKLDQGNGSGVKTSRYNFLTGPVASAVSALARTPIQATVNTLTQKWKGGATASKKPALASTGAAATLGSQALLNMLLRSSPMAKGAALSMIGSPVGLYLLANSGNMNESEARSRDAATVMISAASDIPKNLSNGQYGLVAQDAAALAALGATETLLGKVWNKDEYVGELRSALDYKTGSPMPYKGSGSVTGAITGLMPTVMAPLTLPYDIAKQAYDYPADLISDQSKIPMIRQVARSEFDINPKKIKTAVNEDTKKKIRDAVKGSRGSIESILIQSGIEKKMNKGKSAK